MRNVIVSWIGGAKVYYTSAFRSVNFIGRHQTKTKKLATDQRKFKIQEDSQFFFFSLSS